MEWRAAVAQFWAEHERALERRSYYPPIGEPDPGNVIVCDATHRAGGVCAAAVVHRGEVVAADVFRASSSNRAELHGMALAARYAAEQLIEVALFLCDNMTMVGRVRGGRLSLAQGPDREWLRLFREREGWVLEHAPRRMVREAHHAAAAALKSRYPGIEYCR